MSNLIWDRILNCPYAPVGAVLPNLDGVEYRTGQATPILSCPSRPFGYWRVWSQQWRLWALCPGSRERQYLVTLPTELLLLIAMELPIPSQASLALTCRRLFGIVSEFNPFAAIALPAEQPLDFQSPRMSKAQIYQPARWEFLRSSERDLNGKWLLCSECFILHPRWMFSEYEKCIVPWHKEYYRAHGSDFRSCRQGRKEWDVETRSAWLPSGVVDLCPCIKLTIGRKCSLEVWLREKKARSPGNNGPAADFWWHECRHSYGDINIELRIGLFLYDGTEASRFRSVRGQRVANKIFSMPPMAGELGVLLEYRHTYPLESPCSSPRLLCPHRNLHIAINELLRCRKSHGINYKDGTFCRSCRKIQYCQECGTKVLDLKSERTSAGNIDSSFRVEKCLDGSIWPMHTVFPFARRQVPLQLDSLWPE